MYVDDLTVKEKTLSNTYIPLNIKQINSHVYHGRQQTLMNSSTAKEVRKKYTSCKGPALYFELRYFDCDK